MSEWSQKFQVGPCTGTGVKASTKASLEERGHEDTDRPCSLAQGDMT